jgi:ZIP family zinc transporter
MVYWVKLSRRVVGALAGFGAGAMLSAISFDLLAETNGLEPWQLGLWMMIGAGRR